VRAIWKGHINFALVSIPVAVVSGSKTSDISLKYLHKADLSPVSYRRFCAAEAREVEWDEITRGYEFEKGRFVEVTQEELQEANADLTRSIRILQFVDLAEIDPVYFDKPYYLAPQPGGEHAYHLLVEALGRSEKAGIAKVVLKTREHLAAIRPSGRLMSMQTLRFAHEIVDPASVDLPEATQLESQELKLADTLIGTMCAPFDPAAYKDEYRAEVLDVIRRKVAGAPPGQPTGAPAAPGKVVDLMEVLRQSLEGRSKQASIARREKTVAVRPRTPKKTRSRSRT
jgi:DNA end-binding protein Ku